MKEREIKRLWLLGTVIVCFAGFVHWVPMVLPAQREGAWEGALSDWI